jgi:hypothetical protein
MTEERKERVIWLGCRIAEKEGGKWLRFDKGAKRFGVSPRWQGQSRSARAERRWQREGS